MTAVSTGARVQVDQHETFRRTFLDTADWRAHGRGWLVEADRGVGDAGPVTLTLRDRSTEVVLGSAVVDWIPRYGTDLPKTPLWAGLADAIEGRRLLVQAETTARSQQIALLNEDSKTTARLRLERFALDEPGGGRRLLRVATVQTLRGYEGSAQQLCAVLENARLAPLEESVLVLALAASGQPGPGPAPGPAVHLDRAMPARRAMALVLGRLREHLVANEQGVVERLDDEFLHEFRVAVRRARSIVKTTKSALGGDEAAHFAVELAWLGTVTSPIRDLDVHIEELAVAESEDLVPLRDYLTARRDDAQIGLVAALRSRRYSDLVEEWRRMAQPGTARSRQGGSTVGQDSASPIGEMSDRYIWRAYRRVVRDGEQIGPTSPPESLHDLRKRAKELRYLLECFQTLYPEEDIRVAIKELKAFQDNLGEYQDCQVQAAALLDLAEEIMASRSAPAPTLMAMGRLAEEQQRRELRSRDEFSSRFARFSSRDNRRRFAVLCSREKSAEGAGQKLESDSESE